VWSGSRGFKVGISTREINTAIKGELRPQHFCLYCSGSVKRPENIIIFVAVVIIIIIIIIIIMLLLFN
jgi:hypothetical protein